MKMFNDFSYEELLTSSKPLILQRTLSTSLSREIVVERLFMFLGSPLLHVDSIKMYREVAVTFPYRLLHRSLSLSLPRVTRV